MQRWSSAYVFLATSLHLKELRFKDQRLVRADAADTLALAQLLKKLFILNKICWVMLWTSSSATAWAIWSRA